ALGAGNRTEAATWLEEALEAARRMGEPLGIARALVGLALAREGDLDQAAHAAAASTSYPGEAERLLDALRRADRAELQAQLPTPRTKLNLPYAPVNL